MSRYSLIFIVFLVSYPSLGNSIEKPGVELERASVKTELGAEVPLHLEFMEAGGAKLTPLTEFTKGKPSILVPVYFHCPRLCGLVLSGVKNLLQKITLNLGEDYNLLAVSFDPSESKESAAQKKQEITKEIHNYNEKGVYFFVGDKENVQSLMKSIGFNYFKDGEDFAHSAEIIILTPEGKISQYFTGIEFSPWDVKLSLVQASSGGIGSMLDHAFLFCFRFDPTKGKYTWAAFNFMRVGGLLTFLFLVGMVVYLLRNEWVQRGNKNLKMF